MTVSLSDVAKAAGVSPATASRAISNSSHPMDAATKAKILKVARRLGYQPNLVARSLRTDRTNTVGIICENILSPFIPPIIRGIQDHLRKAGYFSTIVNSDRDRAIEEEAINALNHRQMDGIIFVETWHRSAKAIRKITDKPFAFVHRVFRDEAQNAIRVDEVYGARLAVGHLIALGHRRIAYISGPKDWDASKERRRGYQTELAAHSIPFDARLVTEGDWEVKGGYEAAQKLIARAKRPTAIFAANDMMALGAIYAIQEAGLRVPDDIAVVGYDNRNLAKSVRPALTTVTLPAYEMGDAAAKLLLNLINEVVSDVDFIEIQGKLIVRQSCGGHKGNWEFEAEDGVTAWRTKRRRAINFQILERSKQK